MLCPNCGSSIADAARFCSSCGAQQRAQPSLQAAQPEGSDQPAIADDAFAASDVTIILPRGRAKTLVAQTAQRADAPPPQPPASNLTFANPAPHRRRVPVLTIGATAIVVVIAVFVALAFHGKRPAPDARLSAASATSTPSTPAPMPAPAQTRPPDGLGPSDTEPPPMPQAEPASVVTAPAAAAPDAPVTTLQGADTPTSRATAPAREGAPRRRARAVATPAVEPVPVESPPLPPVEVAPPPPASVAPSLPVEPAKVEKVACADSSNPFSREACLWQECAKPEFRSHAECARFAGPGGR
jgi:zinc ribbon protein